MNNMLPVWAGYFTVYPTSNAALVLGVRDVVVYPANLVIKKLTVHSVRAMLNSLSQKTKAGIGVLNVAAQPQTCGFFVSNAQLPIMSGWAGQPSGWPVATPVRQLRSVRLPMIGVVWRRVYNLFSGVAIMKVSTQNPASSCPETVQYSALNPAPQVKSIFNLVTVSNRVLFTGLAFTEALALLVCHPHAKIKFSHMEGVQ